jgi:protease-4
MKKIVLIILAIFMLLTCCVICVTTTFLVGRAITTGAGSGKDSLEFVAGDSTSKNKILLIKINGTIVDKEEDVSSLFTQGYVFGYDIKAMLYDAVDDKEIKAVMFEISSGGGTVVGSKAIVDGIKYFKQETNAPVYAYVRGMAASGAYMVASSCDYIISDYGSLTGSIGVMYGSPFKYYDTVTSESNGGEYVVTQKGIETFYISAGESKDLGNPYRKMTQDELKVLQEGINDEYEDFVALVSKGRSIKAETIKNDIKALIYSNKQAKANKLIDEEGSYDMAIDKIATKAGLDKYQIISSKSQSLLSMFLSSNTNQKSISSMSPLQNRILMIYGDPTMYNLSK